MSQIIAPRKRQRAGHPTYPCTWAWQTTNQADRPLEQKLGAGSRMMRMTLTGGNAAADRPCSILLCHRYQNSESMVLCPAQNNSIRAEDLISVTSLAMLGASQMCQRYLVCRLVEQLSPWSALSSQKSAEFEGLSTSTASPRVQQQVDSRLCRPYRHYLTSPALALSLVGQWTSASSRRSRRA